jgi:hypothetical protein
MKLFRKVYAVLTLLVVLDLIFYLIYYISLPGHWFDWFLFWSWIIATIYLLVACFKDRWVKIYAILLAGFTLLTMLPMMIPFIMIVSFAIDIADTRYKISEELELQEHAESPIAVPMVVAIQSYELYERITSETEFDFKVGDEYFRIEDAISIKKLNVDHLSDTLSVEFRFESGFLTRKFKRKN